jgi:hypothetical protein
MAKKIYYRIMIGGQYPPKRGTIYYAGKCDEKGFNELKFYEGKEIEDWPDGITFFVKGQRGNDYVSIVIHWILVSEKVRETFEKYDIQGAQLLPVRLIHNKTGKEFGPYWVINVFQEVDALDWDNTVWLPKVTNPREAKYPSLGIVRYALQHEPLEGKDIFRLIIRGKSSTSVFISERLKQCLEEADAISGFAFEPVLAY